jgi:acetyltransferase
MESVKKPQKLLKHARSLILKGCTIMGIKSGVTEAGKRAAASHTGAMSTSDTAVQALFDKEGIIRLVSKQEMVDVGCALSILGNQFQGNRACIVTDAGGPVVMLADELNRQGWKMPVLKKSTQKKLLEHLPIQSSVTNPIDCLPSQTAVQTRNVFKILEEEERENLDVIVILTGNSMLNDKWETYQEIIEGMENCSIPIIPMLSAVTTTADLIAKLKSSGKTYFYEEVAVGQALGKILKRPNVFKVDEEVVPIKHYNPAKIESVLGKCKTVLTPFECRELLMATGIKTPHQVEVFQLNELSAACDQLRFPVVMKVIGPLHKSDVGGVKVGLQNTNQVIPVWHQMVNINGAEGVLLQEVVSGNEMIMEVSKEESYGHIIMFGLGGIYTEILKDVRFKLCPLSREESLDMIRSIRAFSLLTGVRGEKGMSSEILSDYLIRLSRLVMDFPQIKEIDLNPVKGVGDELFAIDSRILID